MRMFLCSVVIACLAGLAYAADMSWKLPLAEKEKVLENSNVERHNVLGLYPSLVDIPIDGGPVDNTTLGNHNIAHAVCWTSNYLAGASYRYAALKKSNAPAEEVAKALARADEIFEAIYRCQLVTGVRGLQARGYAIGHGESYEERWGDRTSPYWEQGAGEYKDLRWRGDPSHHNYSDAIHGLGQYYDLAAQGAQKDRCREAIDALVGYWVDNDFKVLHYDRKRVTSILGFTDGKTLNTRIMMAIAGAKVAYHATGNAKYKTAYDKLIDQYGVRGLKSFKTDKGFDDAEHVFCHLENLFRMETDPELLAAYRVVLDTLWNWHKDDAQSLFTYIYMSLTPNAPDREKAIKEALYSLQTWPTDMTFRPTMSSLRKDLKPPYPVYAASWDNEYIWKGNLLRPDGWLSRTVTGVAVPAEDPMVIYAIDELGDVYQSRDGAATAAGWHFISETLGSPARKIVAGPRVRMIYVVCDDGFHASMTGGYKWVKLDAPEEGGKAVDVVLDPAEPQTVYALREKATYRMQYKSNRDFSGSWELWKKSMPKSDKAKSKVEFKAGEGGVLRSVDGGKTWEAKATGLDIPLSKTVFAPGDTDWAFAGTPAGLYFSKDGGETWQDGHLVLQFIRNERRDLGGAAFIDAYWRARYYGFIDDAAANASYQGDR